MSNITVAKSDGCNIVPHKYETLVGTLTVPGWEAGIVATLLVIVITITFVGNVLVILSVFTHKPLQLPQNYFLVSLAVADLTVTLFVQPLNVVNQLLGHWKFGSNACKMWLTFDILCCTASILHLCAIALDRYWAITDPLNYAQKRTPKRVLFMITSVWTLSAVISSPPLAGWNNWPKEFNETTMCNLTEELGYRVYSSLGSFYIPLFIMGIVYLEIFIATKRRLRVRERASKLNFTRLSIRKSGSNDRQLQRDLESFSSDTAQDDSCSVHDTSQKTLRQWMQHCMIWRRQTSRELQAEESATDTDTEDHPSGIIVGPNLDPNGEKNQPASTRNSINKRKSGKTVKSSNSLLSVALPSPVPKKREIEPEHIVLKKRISLSKERRAARTLGIIMGVFVICWLPFFLMYVIVPFCPKCCPPERLFHFLTWLGYINSGLNPIIYTIFNMDFRKAFKKLLHLK